MVDRENRNRICDIGEQGELFLRAAGLAEGYRGQDENTKGLNNQKFLTNWFVDPQHWIRRFEKITLASQKPWMSLYKGPRDRLYRTGDLGRFRSDGSVECTGRVDSQVKIRGFRVELGEIDTHLSRHPYIRENVTMLRRDEGEDQQLVSYIVPEARQWLEHLEKDGRHLGNFEDESMASMLKRFKSLSEDCRSFLKEKVPHYAVPSMFIPLVRMPLSKLP